MAPNIGIKCKNTPALFAPIKAIPLNQNKNAIIPGLANSNSINHYKFSKIPSGQLAYLLAYRNSGTGYMLAYSQVTIGFMKSINLKPEYKTKEEFEYLIDSFLN